MSEIMRAIKDLLEDAVLNGSTGPVQPISTKKLEALAKAFGAPSGEGQGTLVAALNQIIEGSDCGCECNDENCCERVGSYCPKCIAQNALNSLAAVRGGEKGQPQKGKLGGAYFITSSANAEDGANVHEREGRRSAGINVPSSLAPPAPAGDAAPLSANEEQRRSFVHGNCAIGNPKITRRMVDEEAEKMAAPAAQPLVEVPTGTISEPKIYGLTMAEIGAALQELAALRAAQGAEVPRGVEFNRRYGHADNCKFGMENSGFCSCGHGFRVERSTGQEGAAQGTSPCGHPANLMTTWGDDCGQPECMNTPYCLACAYLSSPRSTGQELREEQIKHMVRRFLGWRLPENFRPDAGISFNPEYNIEYNAKRDLPPSRHEPVGTNLLDAMQAEAMIRYLIEGLPPAASGSADSLPVRAHRWIFDKTTYPQAMWESFRHEVLLEQPASEEGSC